MLRPDFFDLVGYAVDRRVGVKFSTNGTRLTATRARQLAALPYLDVQVSIDEATVATNDAVRGEGSFAGARTAVDKLAAAGFGAFKVSVVEELDALAAIDDAYGV
jgi:[mycofactocin precursor peptide]-tyrosine decarboxylase / 3-amino-5-[(4-hydroxyphenyl)methyl]-4,4-dimethylpyrrolidin-2-one synthase